MVMKNIPPWVAVMYCCLMQTFTVGICIYSFALFVVPWIEEFSVDRSSVMIAITGFSLASAILAPLGGWLVDRYQSRYLVLGGLMLFCLSLVALSQASSTMVITLLFTLVLPVGATLAGSVIALYITTSRVKTRRGLAIGITSLGTSLGGFFLPLLVTFLLSAYSWRVTFIMLAAAVMIVVFLPGLFLLDRDPVVKSDTQKRQAIDFEDIKAITLLGTCFLVPSILFVGVLHNVAIYAKDIGVSQTEASLVISSCALVMAAGKLMAGVLSDRTSLFRLYFTVLVFCGVAMFTISTASSFYTLLIGVNLLAFFMGWVIPIIAGLVGSHWQVAMFGRAMGLVSAMAGLAGLGSFVAALVRDRFGDYAQAFSLLSILLIIALVAFILFMRLSQRKQLEIASVSGE